MTALRRDDTKDCFVMFGKMVLPVQYFAGRVGSRFIISLRDDRKILGVRVRTATRSMFLPGSTAKGT